MALQEFINQYSGKPNVGNTPQNSGQCVGLVEVWLNAEMDPQIWGNAKDLPANADRSKYDVSTTGIPSSGDVFCFDGFYGGGVGHTGIVVNSDARQVTLFQQNDPEGSTPHTKSYPYAHMAGWIHPKNLINAGGIPMVDRNMAIDLGVGILGRSIADAMAPDYLASVVGQPVDVVIRNLVNSPEGKAFRNRTATTPTVVVNGVTYKPAQ